MGLYDPEKQQTGREDGVEREKSEANFIEKQMFDLYIKDFHETIEEEIQGEPFDSEEERKLYQQLVDLKDHPRKQVPKGNTASESPSKSDQ